VTILAEYIMHFRLLVLLAALTAAPSAAAQVTVTPIRDLAFGPVIVGIPSTVGPSHPTRSGQFRLTAPVGTRIQMRFTLPNQLNGPAGAQLPITFTNSDGMYVGSWAGSTPTTFNPKATRNLQFTGGTTYNVFIGGRVTPAANQRQGNYAATITITVNIH
jgi:hypothetical protein